MVDDEVVMIQKKVHGGLGNIFLWRKSGLPPKYKEISLDNTDAYSIQRG